MTEKRTREFKPADTSNYSFRDQLRELMRLKYGMRGKQFAESLLGESEEEKYMKYLIRNYGYTPSPETQLPESRPMRDMLNVQGGGPSDLGALDVVLMGLSGAGKRVLSPMAAGTETAMLGGDAYGEYKKGNPGTAALMLGAAGLPPLLAYKFRPTRADQELKTELQRTTPSPGETDTPMDPSRRKALGMMGTGIVGLAASKLAPDITQTTKAMTSVPVKGIARATPPLKELSNNADTLLFNNELVTRLLPRGFDSETLRLQETYDQPLILEELANMDVRNMSLDDIRSKMESKFLDYDNYPLESKEVFDMYMTDEYITNAIDTIENIKEAIKNDPETANRLAELERYSTLSNKEIEAEYGSIEIDRYYDIMDDVRSAVEKYTLKDE